MKPNISPRVSSWLLALAVFVGGYAMAVQNDLQMPTTGTVSGLQFSNRVTDALDALVTCNSGSSAPTNAAGGAPKAGQCWLDTTSATLLLKKRYSGSAWVTEAVIDVSNGIWTPPIGGGASTIASATTTSICGATVPHAYLSISGTTTITAFGTGCAAGQVKVVRFEGALTLTYNVTSLIIPGAIDVLTVAGDTAVLLSEGSGNWRVALYSRGTGEALANPAVPVGTVLTHSGLTAPTKYAFGYGQDLDRTTYSTLFDAVTSVQTVSRTSGSPTLTGFTDIEQFGSGQPIEGTGIPASTTVSSCTGTSCTMSANATTTGTSDVRVIPWGATNTSTFKAADCRGSYFAYRENMGATSAGRLTSTYFGGTTSRTGAFGGQDSTTLVAGNHASHTHALSGGSVTTSSDGAHTHLTSGVIRTGTVVVNEGATSTVMGGNLNDVATTSNGTHNHSVSGTSDAQGSATPFSRIGPTRLANCIVRVLP